jgi:hypothetical protein
MTFLYKLKSNIHDQVILINCTCREFVELLFLLTDVPS